MLFIIQKEGISVTFMICCCHISFEIINVKGNFMGDSKQMISRKQARQFLINYHNLNDSQGYVGMAGIVAYFKQVGSIQYDPLNVVGRNADLVLQSRVKDYKPEMLQELLYTQHKLVDGFDKEMCIYLAEDFNRFNRVRIAQSESTKNTLNYRNQLGALDILDEIRECIITKGRIGSKDISIGENRESRWGHKKLSSAALDYLYNIGELCVADKIGTQKIYDFTAHVLNKKDLQIEDFKSEEDFLDWYVKRRVCSVGLLWDKRGGAWQGQFLSEKKLRERVLQRLVEEGEIVQLFVEDINVPFYLAKEHIQFFDADDSKSKVKFLAPLDNLLWDREMVSKLFDFDYRWEVYTPIEKRKYGYYVLPVLYGDRMIARFEPEKVRRNTPLTIKNWWWESGVTITSEMLEAIDSSIKEFANYLEVPAPVSLPI